MTTVIQTCDVTEVTSSNTTDLQIGVREQEDRMIKEAKGILFRRLMKNKPVMHSPKISRDFLFFELAKKETEGFHVLFLDNQHRLIKFKKMFEGTIDQCNVYPREIVKAALELNAAAVMFAHNHPSHDATPSQADKKMTQRLIDGLALLDIRVLDHFIVGGDKITSFAELGLI